NIELDARMSDMGIESGGQFYDVGSPADRTKRPLPPPLLVVIDNELVVWQLSHQNYIDDSGVRKLAQQVWQMIVNVDVKFEWIHKWQNPARKILRR
ncbi:hypothetical protein LCGC14_3002550, partial [marine sediment metagenome]